MDFEALIELVEWTSIFEWINIFHSLVFRLQLLC